MQIEENLGKNEYGLNIMQLKNISTIVQENLKNMKPVTSAKTLVRKPRRHGRESMRSSSTA